MSPAWILAGLGFHLLLLGKGSADEIFYPFDVDEGGDRSFTLKGDDEFKEIRLAQPIKYGNELYSVVYVNTNGYVSFDPPPPQYQNLQFPFPLPLIAPLYSNVDTSARGQVFARESNSDDLIQRSAETIKNNYPNNLAEFQPRSLLIVTWDDVGYYKEGSDKGNSYQLVISTDGEESYAELLYKENGIEWIQAESKNEETEIRGQAGFILPNGRLFALPGTGTDHVKTLDTKSNYNSPGKFIYRIGNIAEDRAELQEPVTAEEAPKSEPTSCDDGGRATCDANADCTDKNSGFCCRCSSSFFGNGLACIQKTIPRRMVGIANVNINGIVQKELNFQGYIVVQDGRVYAAVDQVSHRIGREMELISVLSGAPGWLFANPSDGAVNGFQLTGGKLEHLTEMQFDAYHHLRIHQTFKGLDAQERLLVEVDISGKVPMLNPSTSITIPDFAEEYTRVGPGEFRSRSKHIINFNDRERIEVSIDQTIKYKEHCPSEEDFPPQRLTVTKTFVSYNEHKEVIVRLASFYNISKSSDVTDPCILGKAQCIANSSCIVDGLSFKCVCNHGFQASSPEEDGNDLGCVDINECDDSSYFCHQNAICVNEIGSYSCHCNSGYSGDGRSCEPLQTELSPHMSCEDPNIKETCTCDNGYRMAFTQGSFTCVDIDECAQNVCGDAGDKECYNFEGGFECRCPFGFSQDQYGICRTEGCDRIRCPGAARCEVDEYGRPGCVCLEGFTGNPPDCYPIEEYATTEYYDYYDCRNCPPLTICINDRCQCTYGYTGTPDRCTPIRESPDECESDRDCQPNAQCDYNSGTNTKTCQCSNGYISNGNDCIVSSTVIFARTCMNDECWCPPGFVYKGKYCVQGVPSANQIPSEDCSVENNCDENAECLYIKPESSHKCMCRPGYEGNGINCHPMTDISCFDSDICHINATCVVDEGKPICICNDNFVGDGSVCYPKSVCSEDFYCETHSHCIYNQEKEYQECICDEGYEHQITNEKGQCVPIQSSPSCDDCHPNSTCTVYEQGGISCYCNEGFRGDGLRCEEEDRGCDVLGNCSPYADCLFSPEARGYRCACREGFEGDGMDCTEIVTCRTDYRLCSEFATCEYLERQYTCRCQEGYFGNGTYCREASKQDEEFLLLAKGRAIIKLPLEPTQSGPAGHPISVINQQNAIGIAIDCVEAKVYWSDVHGSKIYKSNYDGTEQESFVTNIRSPEGLAVDWIQRRLYWTDSGYHNISSADLDTKKIHDVITLNRKSNPRGITVHPWKRKVIWTDWIRENPRIEWANYDGSGREVLVSSPYVQLPNSLAIDWASDDLCWADAGKKHIGCINLNTREPRIVIPKLVYPFGITISPEKFYWTDWNTKKVHMARKDSKGTAQQIDVPLGGHDRLTSIVAVSACPK